MSVIACMLHVMCVGQGLCARSIRVCIYALAIIPRSSHTGGP